MSYLKRDYALAAQLCKSGHITSNAGPCRECKRASSRCADMHDRVDIRARQNASNAKLGDAKRETRAAWREVNREKIAADKRVWRLATGRTAGVQFQRPKNFVAALCSRGHFSAIASDGCVECRRDHLRCVYAHDRKAHNARTQAHYALNSDRYRAKNREYAKANRPAYRARMAAWIKANPERYRLMSAQGNMARRVRITGAEGTHTRAEWLAIVARQNDKCLHCPQTGNLTRDHIVPLSRGGSNYASNIQGLCKPCNSRKGARIPTNAV